MARGDTDPDGWRYLTACFLLVLGVAFGGPLLIKWWMQWCTWVWR